MLNTRPARLARLLAFLLVLGLIGAACGGGASDDGDVASEIADEGAEPLPSASPEAEPEPEPTEAPEPTATPEPEPTATPEPEPIDASNLQERLLDAQPGDVIEIPAGVFEFDRGLSLTVDGVTIRGAGIDDTILSFAGQVAGAEGLLVTASDFTIEDLAIEDTVGDALKINEGENIVVRRVRTEWTGGYSVDNGAYGIYPVQTTNVLIEDSVAIGASDAGIYVGQSTNIIVRNNEASFNVAGIEIENSVNADVYGNTATDNTGGVLVFNLAGLSMQGSHTRVYDNEIIANNTENFAAEGTAVASVPAGTGVLVMANDDVEIFGNRIQDNRSANVVVTSIFTAGFDNSEAAPDFDGYPERVFIYDNEMGGGGYEPDSILRALQLGFLGADGVLPDIVWDGDADPEKLVDGVVADENRICVQNGEADVLNADAGNGFAETRIDNEAHDCELPKLEPVVLDDLE
ncbi:MAG: parallel beta-helix domain-containing protein [Actinomycetota bacterium]